MRRIVAAGAACAALAALAAPPAAAQGSLANPPLVVSIRGAGAAHDPGVDVAALISGALGGRLVSMVEPTLEEARAALFVADVVYLNVRQRSSSQHGAAGVVFGRGDDEVLSTRSLANALSQGSPPPRLVLVNGSIAGADLGAILDAEKTAVVGFSAPVHGPGEEKIFARLMELFAACQGTTCPTLREAFAALPEVERPAILTVRGRGDLRYPSLAGHAGNADVSVEIQGLVRTPKGKPAKNAQITAPAFPGASTTTDDTGRFVLTVTTPIACDIRVRASRPHLVGNVTAGGGPAKRDVKINLEDAPDDIAALAQRLSVTIPQAAPYEVNDAKTEDLLRELVFQYLHDARVLKFSVDELAPLIARLEQAVARGTRHPTGPGGLSPAGNQVALCDNPQLRYLYGRVREMRTTYEQRFSRVNDVARKLQEKADQAPHLADRTDAAAILAAARLLRRDNTDNLRRLDAAGYTFRSLGCREELMDVARPLYDPDIPFDFADRLPGGTHPTTLPPR